MKKLMVSIAAIAVGGAIFYAGERYGFHLWYKKFGAPLGVTVDQANKNTGGQYFYKQLDLGPHKYIVCDFPDARGKRNSSFIHDPTCPCGKNFR